MCLSPVEERGRVWAFIASFLHANQPTAWGRTISDAAHQSWPFRAQPQTPEYDPTHPKSLTLSLQAPIPSSAAPKASYALSLTSSAPICQNHNPYTSPLITKQEEHHLKINLPLNPVFWFLKGFFSLQQQSSAAVEGDICGKEKLQMLMAWYF